LWFDIGESVTDRNENRLGYKKTKVGWIPKEWKPTALREIGVMRSGGTPSKEVASFWKGNIPWFTAKDLKSFRLKTSQDTITEEGLLKGSRLAPAGSILILVRGMTLFRDLPVGVLDIPAGFNQDIKVIELLKGFDSLFVGYAITARKEGLKRLVEHAGHGTGRIDTGLLQDCLFPFPPHIEQKKIAEILSTWDTAIEQTRKLIEAKKRLKKALMQQLLTDKKRLPGFAKSKDRNSYRFFELPTDWKCSRIREIAREYSERNAQRDKITVLSCSKHIGFVESSKYFGKQIFSADTSKYKIIRRGYFGYPSNHIEEGSIGLLLNHDIGMVSPIYTVFKCNENVVPEFLYALFKTDTYRHIFAISTNSSVDRRGSLRWRGFSLIQVPNPSKEEQHAIVDVLQAADYEIHQLNKKLKVLEKQKRGLMQKLLTGEIRVTA
jgi:type I restriction enzyme S subunit